MVLQGVHDADVHTCLPPPLDFPLDREDQEGYITKTFVNFDNMSVELDQTWSSDYQT